MASLGKDEWFDVAASGTARRGPGREMSTDSKFMSCCTQMFKLCSESTGEPLEDLKQKSDMKRPIFQEDHPGIHVKQAIKTDGGLGRRARLKHPRWQPRKCPPNHSAWQLNPFSLQKASAEFSQHARPRAKGSICDSGPNPNVLSSQAPPQSLSSMPFQPSPDMPQWARCAPAKH